ncbi:MAG: DUF4252 domain-containing protein [Bacteroidota bacterium]
MIRFIIAALTALLLASCDSKPTVQKYFVQKAEDKSFMAVDIAPSIIKTDKLQLNAEEKKALDCLEHINVLVFKANDANKPQFEKEKMDVKNLLKTENYDELIKFNSGEGGGSIRTKGEGEHIEEFVVYVHQKDNGFGLVRVTGNDMTPANVMTIAGLMGKGGLNMDQLKPLQALMQTNDKK